MKLLLWLMVVGFLVGIWRAGNVALLEALEERLSHACRREVSIQSLKLTSRPGMRLVGVSLTGRPAPAWGLPGGPGQGQESEELLWIGQMEGRVELPALLRARPIFLFDVPEMALTDRDISPPVQWRVRNLHLQLECVPRGYFSHARGELLGEEAKPVGQFEWSGEPSLSGTGKGHFIAIHRELQCLAPYFMRLLGAAPAQGALQLESHVTAAGEELTVENDLTANNLIFPTAEPTVLGPTGNEIVRLLQDSREEIRLDFLLQGKMANGFDWSEQIVVALRESLAIGMARSIQQALSSTQPIHTVEETLQKSLESSEH